MAKETKIGLSFIMVLIGALCFVMYKRLDKHNDLLPNVIVAGDFAQAGQGETHEHEQDGRHYGEGGSRQHTEQLDPFGAGGEDDRNPFVPDMPDDDDDERFDSFEHHENSLERQEDSHGHGSNSTRFSENTHQSNSTQNPFESDSDDDDRGFAPQSQQSFTQNDHAGGQLSHSHQHGDSDRQNGLQQDDGDPFGAHAAQQRTPQGRQPLEQTTNSFGHGDSPFRGSEGGGQDETGHVESAAGGRQEDSFPYRNELTGQTSDHTHTHFDQDSFQPDAVQPSTVNDSHKGFSQTGRSSQEFFDDSSEIEADSFSKDVFPSDSSDDENSFGLSQDRFHSSHHTHDNFGEANFNSDREEVYVVLRNDNYWKISQKKYGTPRYFAALSHYNKRQIPDPKRMRPGMKVFIPGQEILEARYPNLFPKHRSSRGVTPNPTKITTDHPAGFFWGHTGHPMYCVGKHDTLTFIAKEHLGRASRWIQIYKMNSDRMPSPNSLKIGTELRLPADASRVQLVRDPHAVR
jgi:nucleoid-associated protein YgaU